MKLKPVFLLVVVAIILAPVGRERAYAQDPLDHPVYFPIVIKAATSAGAELIAAYQGQYAGTIVNVLGPFTNQDEIKFNNAVQSFENETGITILYAGSKQFDVTLSVAVNGGTPPDIADFPYPNLLASYAAAGKILDAGKVVNPDWLKQNYSQAWLDLAKMKDQNGGTFTAGIWARATGKDLVWYPKKAFDAAGYKVPTTWDELMALSNRIISDGDLPWCIGIESGAATGWTATDWVEALMLRTTTPENYDKWIAGTLKFDSPEVRNAISYMIPIWFNDKMVYGGTKAITTINFVDAPRPMFSNPPYCWLHKQGNFITSFFPSNLVAGIDYDVFYLPTIDPTMGKPFEAGGDIYAAFNDRPEVRAVLQYFSMGESNKTWIQAGSIISPQNDASLDWYPDPTVKAIAGMIKNATVVRLDASDQMPGVVGTGTFWQKMTQWVFGSITLDTALTDIDASWPH